MNHQKFDAGMRVLKEWKDQKDRESAKKFGMFTAIFFSGYDDPTIRKKARVYLEDTYLVDFITALRHMISINCTCKNSYEKIVETAISIYGNDEKFGCFKPSQLLTCTMCEITKFALLKKKSGEQ